ELRESIVTDTGIIEKQSTQIENIGTERAATESFQSDGSQPPVAPEQQADKQAPSGGAEKPSNIPDLDELADRIAATGYGGFGDGFGDSGSGGSGSDGSSSSS
ncbi:hypothetical protein, partial [Roseiconus nitratireducens]|uniref:hypothetical protein n=1 Tax=Roseiconus nitratireducens TaxID=2605748 RepID=UPI00191C3CFB